jgi:hypothetical protein
MSDHLVAREAFFLSNHRFQLTKEFHEALLRSHNVFLIVGFGPTRSGKSTRLNELIQGRVRAEEPFCTDGGTAPVTGGIKFYGPFPFDRLGFQGSAEDIDVDSNADVFVLDCKGFDNFKGETAGFRKAVVAAVGIANVSILVVRELNRHDVRFIDALLQWSANSSESFPGFRRGMLIMQPDVGIARRVGASHEDRDRERRRQDIAGRDALTGQLKKPHEVVNSCTLTMLCQPELVDEALYVESMKDATTAIVRVGKGSRLMNGREVVERLNGIAGMLDDAKELEIGDGPFEQSFGDYMNHPVSHSKLSNIPGWRWVERGFSFVSELLFAVSRQEL